MGKSKDFTLPVEEKPSESKGMSLTLNTNLGGREPMSGKEILVGSLIVLVAALMFFFLSRWLTDMLVKKRKSPRAASRAGWSLFFFLVFTTALLVFGGIGHLWTSWMFLAPMGLLVFLSLIMCLVSVVSSR